MLAWLQYKLQRGFRMSNCQVKKGEKDLIQLLEEIIREQKRLIIAVEDLRKEHEELKDEIKIQNFVLNSIPFRTEVLN
jgi:hypothetical protein